MARVAVIGVGESTLRPESRDKFFKELMYEAAYRAYLDAGVDPREDVDAFITASEDLWEGLAIFDEYVPDQLGGVLKPVFTVGGDGLNGVIHGYMLIKTGRFDVVAVEAHSKASEVENIETVIRFALDPRYLRNIVGDVNILPALEMQTAMESYGFGLDVVNQVVMKNHLYGSMNGGVYAENLDELNIEGSEVIAPPLRKVDKARYVDGGYVVVLASEKYVHENGIDNPVWILGVGWATQGGSFERSLEYPGEALAAAGEMAYGEAGITDPSTEIDVAEVDDRFSYREPVSLKALDLSKGDIYEEYQRGVYDMDGSLPVNISGGFLSNGYPLEAGGLFKLAYLVRQLRGEAGPTQIGDVSTALVSTRREIPSNSYSVLVLGV